MLHFVSINFDVYIEINNFEEGTYASFFDGRKRKFIMKANWIEYSYHTKKYYLD